MIASVGSALPPNVYTNEEVLSKLGRYWSDEPRLLERLGGLHGNTGVKTRHFSLPIDAYDDLTSFGIANRAWLKTGLELGEAAIRDALDQAGIGPRDVDAIFFTSITGISCPSLDARLMNRMGFRTDTKRVPMFGLGCVAGAAGIARAADYLAAFPGHTVLLLSVELCSLTFQRGNRSMAQLVATGLFGDGAAAVVLMGEERASRAKVSGPRVLASRSVFYPDTEDVMGWDITEEGFKILLSPRVPELARDRLGPDAQAFLGEHGYHPSQMACWVAHPGGPKVLMAVQEVLELPPDALRVSWQVLERVGNLSSASVLLVLQEVLRQPPPEDSRGLLFAMGPAFCSELVLLGW